MRLMLYGLFIAVPSVCVAFAGWQHFGYWVGLFGALMGLAGLLYHLYIHWKKIFLAKK